ncbi:MAG: HEPN domain-containing protein [Bacillota bacterium]
MKETTKEWLRAMRYDQETAEILLEHGRFIYTVFLAVQMVEKAMKALWSETKEDYPPHTHNLIKLGKLLGVWKKLPLDQRKFLAFISPLYIAIRYPDVHVAAEDDLDLTEAEDILSQSQEVCQWLEQQMK